MDTNKQRSFNSLLFLCRNFCVTCVICVSFLFASTTWAHDYDAFPPPDIALPSSFLEFRSHLGAALAAKDIAAVRSFLAEDIKFGFGGSFGPDQFVTGLGLDKPDGEGWGLLAYLISTDAAKVDMNGTEAFMLPYTAEDWPEEEGDPYNIVIGKAETMLRTLPTEDGRIASTLKYPILHIKSEMKNGEWLEVEASNGLWGYISEGETVSFLGFRMLVENRTENNQAKWQISFVGAGD